jgi:hypothetical protein
VTGLATRIENLYSTMFLNLWWFIVLIGPVAFRVIYFTYCIFFFFIRH